MAFPWEISLSGVLACLFLDFLESGPFKYRLPSNITYFRYIDDILLFLPQDIKIEEITEKQNIVECFINFTYEKESYNIIPALDILVIKSTTNPQTKMITYIFASTTTTKSKQAS